MRKNAVEKTLVSSFDSKSNLSIHQKNEVLFDLKPVLNIDCTIPSEQLTIIIYGKVLAREEKK